MRPASLTADGSPSVAESPQLLKVHKLLVILCNGLLFFTAQQ